MGVPPTGAWTAASVGGKGELPRVWTGAQRPRCSEQSIVSPEPAVVPSSSKSMNLGMAFSAKGDQIFTRVITNSHYASRRS
jgi:hypothetical protein